MSRPSVSHSIGYAKRVRIMTKNAFPLLLLLLVVAADTSFGADHDDFFVRLKSRLPPGWTAIQAEAGVIVRRDTPLILYNGWSLPLDDTDAEIEKRKFNHEYRLSVTCKPNDIPLSELQRENTKTDEEMQAKEEEMQDFWGKGGYRPSTPTQHILYKEYKAKLQTLPYHVLPDGKFGESLVYVKSSFQDCHCMFYDVRDKYDCLSAISAILTVIEPVEPHSLRWDGNEKQASELLWAYRPWEKHKMRKDGALR